MEEEQGGMTPPASPEEGPSSPPPQTPPPSGGGSTLNIDPGLANLLSYLLSPIAGIIIYAMEKENKLVRFHALQSIFLWVAAFVVWVVLAVVINVIGAISGGIACVLNMLLPIYGLLVLVVYIMMMIKGYQQEYYKLPVIGDMVDKQLEK